MAETGFRGPEAALKRHFFDHSAAGRRPLRDAGGCRGFHADFRSFFRGYASDEARLLF